jgi:hypothetical protein
LGANEGIVSTASLLIGVAAAVPLAAPCWSRAWQVWRSVRSHGGW